jgi:hypothetical protein
LFWLNRLCHCGARLRSGEKMENDALVESGFSAIINARIDKIDILT